MIRELHGKISEVKVCSCHFDLAFYAMKKFSTTDETDELIRAVSSKIEPCLFFLTECISFVLILLSGQQIIMMVIYMRLSLSRYFGRCKTSKSY